MGSILQDLRDLDSAWEHYRRALAIVLKNLGPEHPTVSIIFNNMGQILHDLGDLDWAPVHFQRALAIDEKTYGPDHPKVAI